MAVLFAAALTIVGAPTASAGRWINGGGLDPASGVPVNFLRFLADEGEGQMTIRCDAAGGLGVDAAVAGGGILPPGVEQGDDVEAMFTFVRGQLEETVAARGAVRVRQDGAVLASITGAAAQPLAAPLLVPGDRVDIGIAGTTRSVPLTDLAERVQSLARRCASWPGTVPAP
jgi:hypothetical protein